VADQSELDLKYFIDRDIYNCPFCNRRHVAYTIAGRTVFDWTDSKKCWVWFAKCDSCGKTSMNLTFEDLRYQANFAALFFRSDVDIDSAIFYSVPTSFFVLDDRIPRLLRELVTEAEGCLKMNYLTGASACTRKAIYEFAVIEHADGEHYEERIKSLKARFPAIDPELFDVLCHIKDMTSDKVHEQSWDGWDSAHLRLFLETLKAVLHEVYVVPDERKRRSGAVRSLLEDLLPRRSNDTETGDGPV